MITILHSTMFVLLANLDCRVTNYAKNQRKKFSLPCAAVACSQHDCTGDMHDKKLIAFPSNKNKILKNKQL